MLVSCYVTPPSESPRCRPGKHPTCTASSKVGLVCNCHMPQFISATPVFNSQNLALRSCLMPGFVVSPCRGLTGWLRPRTTRSPSSQFHGDGDCDISPHL